MSGTADFGRGRKGKVWFPAWAAGRRPDRFTLLLAAAAALGAGLVLLRQASYGPGMLADGLGYITAARDLLAGNGLGDHWGHWAFHPPLYPAMLAGGGLFGFDPYAVAGPLNAIVFGLTVLVTGWWLRRHLQSRFLWLWGCFSIALALPLAEVASYALSEPLFILFTLLALMPLESFLNQRSGTLAMAALLAGPGTAAAQTPTDYDSEDNGLIDVMTLAQLNAIRYDLNGNGDATHADYVAAFPSRDTTSGGRMGCPSGTCTGYELKAGLSFDANGDGDGSDSGDHYYNSGLGWEPLGNNATRFTATFDGNEHTISHLFISRASGTGSNRTGLFGRTTGATLRDISLSNVRITAEGRSGGKQFAGKPSRLAGQIQRQ